MIVNARVRSEDKRPYPPIECLATGIDARRFQTN
jgi:hypothetical protein